MNSLEAVHLTTGYDKEIISEDFTYQFKKGDFVSIIGPNGCGKSTLLKTLARILPSNHGKVLLDGKTLNQYDTKEIAKRLAILAQSSEGQVELSVHDVVSFGRYPYQKGWHQLTKEDEQMIQWALGLTGLTDFARHMVATLSGGQRQRVWIAMALVQDTDILLLDEPTTYLDPAHQLDILNVLRSINQQQGKTIILTIHDINLAARFSNEIIAMKQGDILVSGTPSEVITSAWLRKLFAIDAEIVFHDRLHCPLVLSYEMLKEGDSHA